MPPPANKTEGDEFADYPPILTVQQAAELAQIPVDTLYAWSSQGRMKNCSARAGKHLRIDRDKFVKSLFEGGFNVG
jgi:excisionase family DNA binding protein